MTRTPARMGTAIALFLASLACAGSPGAPEPAPAEPEPAAEPAPSGAALPPGPVEGAWIGLAARADSSEVPVPKIDAALVVWDNLDALRSLPAGTTAEAVGPEGPVPVRFRDIRKIPLGCDGNEQEVAVFDGPELPLGPVWLLPNAGKARFQKAEETSRTEQKAEWKVGPLTVVTSARGQRGKTVVSHSQEERWSKEWEGHPDAKPLDVGAWTPEGLIRSGDVTKAERILLFSWSSLEGFHYEAVRMGPGEPRELEGEPYLYWCAY